LETLDAMNKVTLVWEKQLKIKDKFKNFDGCQFVLTYFIEEENVMFRLFEGKLYGFAFEFFELMAARGNFVSFYQPMKYFDQVMDSESLIPERFPNYQYRLLPDIYFSVGSYVGTRRDVHVTTTFDEMEEIFAITPAEAYNSYEKMILPFDELTWILLILTFLMAFLFIFIVNFTTRKVRDVIYGRDVNTPAFNVVAIFFGIGQTRLPGKVFSRVILMLFILFCLIIRTAYQGVQFDMLTKDMRKPLPKTIADLKDMGYIINYFDSESVRISLNTLIRSNESIM
jgi:hypothetical protein